MHLAEMLVTIFGSVLASSGVWAVVMKMIDRKDAKDKGEDVQTKMLVGLGHDRIMSYGAEILAQGYVLPEQYENLLYLYEPYRMLGGNGSAEKLKLEIDKLPTKAVNSVPHKDSFDE